MSRWTRGQRNRDGLTYEQSAAFWRLAHAIARFRPAPRHDWADDSCDVY